MRHGRALVPARPANLAHLAHLAHLAGGAPS